MTHDLTSGKPLKMVLQFTIPVLLGLLLQQVYSVVDTAIVGHALGVMALGGVGATSSVNYLVIGFCTGLCTGMAIPVAQAFGANDVRQLRRYIGNCVWLCVIVSAALLALTLPACRLLLTAMGTPEEIYNEPENAFVADFIGESNIVDGLMIHDELVEIFGAKFACVDKGFGTNQPVDVVIRPEDIDLVKPEEGTLQGIVTHLIFKGVHYEMEVTTPDGYEWLVHSTDMFPVGEKVGIHVDPFDIQIMNKPASEDEEAVGVNE